MKSRCHLVSRIGIHCRLAGEEPNMKQAVHTDAGPKPVGPFSQGMIVGNLVFTAGEGPLDAQTGEGHRYDHSGTDHCND